MHLGSFMVSILIYYFVCNVQCTCPITLRKVLFNLFISHGSTIIIIIMLLYFCFSLAYSTFFLLLLVFNVVFSCIVAVHFLLARVDNRDGAKYI